MTRDYIVSENETKQLVKQENIIDTHPITNIVGTG